MDEQTQIDWCVRRLTTQLEEVFGNFDDDMGTRSAEFKRTCAVMAAAEAMRSIGLLDDQVTIGTL